MGSAAARSLVFLLLLLAGGCRQGPGACRAALTYLILSGHKRGPAFEAAVQQAAADMKQFQIQTVRLYRQLQETVAAGNDCLAAAGRVREMFERAADESLHLAARLRLEEFALGGEGMGAAWWLASFENQKELGPFEKEFSAGLEELSDFGRRCPQAAAEVRKAMGEYVQRLVPFAGNASR